MVSVVFKTCSKCERKLNISSFHKNTGRLRPDCKDCVGIYSKGYRKNNADTIRIKKKRYHETNPYIKRKSYLKLTYGLTLTDYDALYKQQNGLCKICQANNAKNKGHKHLYVDHCHKTGIIRGLLCFPCNSAIGQLEDNVENMKRAIEYLENTCLNGVCGI